MARHITGDIGDECCPRAIYSLIPNICATGKLFFVFTALTFPKIGSFVPFATWSDAAQEGEIH